MVVSVPAGSYIEAVLPAIARGVGKSLHELSWQNTIFIHSHNILYCLLSCDLSNHSPPPSAVVLWNLFFSTSTITETQQP